MKRILGLVVLAAVMIVNPVLAGDVPRGFMPYSELAKAQEKAKKDKKLVAIVAKGSDDKCPRCAAAMENGVRAVRGDCVLVFTRVSDLYQNKATLPAKLKEVSTGAGNGATVYFYVFDADLTKVVAQAGRDQLEKDKDATRAFKKAVDDARKDIGK